MKSTVLALCFAAVSGSNSVRRFRKVFEVAPIEQFTSPVTKTDVIGEDVFERLLHSEWSSFSYNSYYPGDGFSHQHDHGHGNPSYNDDYYVDPYTVDGNGGGANDADFSQAGSPSGTDDEFSSSPNPSTPRVYPQDFTSVPVVETASPVAPSASPIDPTHSPAASLVTANGVDPTATTFPPFLSQQSEEPTSNTSACSNFPACSAFTGDCCPNSDGVFKSCCFGLTYPPLVLPADEQTFAPLQTDAPSTSWPTTEPPSPLLPTDPITAAPSTPLVVPLESQRPQIVLEKCGMSETERSAQLLSYFPTTEFDSSQSKAMEWMDYADGGILCGSEDHLQQRFDLAVAYFKLDGPNWTNCSSSGGVCDTAERWLSDSSECDWFGVACDPVSEEVTVLTLKDNGLSGDLPSELFSLTKLTGLSLDHNKNITGTIPEALGKLSALEYIELDDNAMTGPLPSSLYSLTTLKALDLNGNQFNGTIDDSISNLSDLMVLQMEDNSFEGPIPWFGLAMLKDLRKYYSMKACTRKPHLTICLISFHLSYSSHVCS